MPLNHAAQLAFNAIISTLEHLLKLILSAFSIARNGSLISPARLQMTSPLTTPPCSKGFFMLRKLRYADCVLSEFASRCKGPAATEQRHPDYAPETNGSNVVGNCLFFPVR